MHNDNFALANSSYASQVIQKSGASGVSLLLFDNKPARPEPVSFIYCQEVQDSTRKVYANDVYQYDPLLPHQTSIYHRCNQFTGINRPEKATDARFPASDSKARQYWQYFATIGYHETAASFQAISSNLYLVIGLHLTESNKHISLEPAAPCMETWLREARDYLIDVSVKHLMSSTDEKANNRQVFDDLRNRLSKREFQVACELLKGKSNKQIAYTLSLSEYTVENYLRRVYKKYNARSRTSLIAAINNYQ